MSLPPDPLDQAPPADREALRAALAELTQQVGLLPKPEVEIRTDLGFILVWKLPDGVIELGAPAGQFSWYTEGPLFLEEDTRMINWGSCVVPPEGSPEACLGGTLVPRFRAWLTRYEELQQLRDQLLRELKKSEDPRGLMRYLAGSISKALSARTDDD